MGTITHMFQGREGKRMDYRSIAKQVLETSAAKRISYQPPTVPQDFAW